jgi:type II secretory pathway pseudopilin PulG
MSRHIPIDDCAANEPLQPQPSTEMHRHAAPTGRKSIARGVSPWSEAPNELKPPRGDSRKRTRTVAPLGLATGQDAIHQGLAPLAIDCRRVAAEKRRQAFTLVEMVTALASAAILSAGLVSTMLIALRASNPANTPAAGMLQALGCMADMAAELQYAVAVTEYTANAITVTVPDRTDANATPETIRYAWSGTAGAPVTRSYNGAAAVNVIPSVQSFALEYSPTAAAADFVTVRIRTTASTRSIVETSFALVNR